MLSDCVVVCTWVSRVVKLWLVWVSRNVGLRCGVCVLCCQTWCGVGVS